MSDWFQQSLTPPQVVELNLRVGVIPERDHVQVMYEAKDPTNGILLGQGSFPHTTMHSLDKTILVAAGKLVELAAEVIDPF
jgi:hypothetical protein